MNSTNRTLKELVEILNKELSPQYSFHLNPIYQTPVKNDGTEILEFLGFSETLANSDVYPISLYHQYNRHPQIQNICKWINDKLFLSSLKQLLNNRNPLYTTELVRLRISVNLINKLDFLTKYEKDEWISYLQLLYYNRHIILNNCYLSVIVELPF